MAEPVQEQASSGTPRATPELIQGDLEKPADNQYRGVGEDPDAQTLLIGTLRNQIQDLFTQVQQLNNKLVQSYDRISDLEENLHVASSNARQSSIKISQLEHERTQHLAALNTGLLVEKSHVTAELTRLREKATEEATQRGQAESARHDIEKELDDLSASLFDQANTMVAEARFARAESERKVEDAERALKGAEEAVAMMQLQMQEMQAQKEQSDRSADDMRILVGKGKWVEKASTLESDVTSVVRLRSSHVPYQEFLLFIAHLRSMRPSSPGAPAISTLLTLPFMARLLNEDTEPTVRLDLAPSLNWLSRRSVLSAIHAGQLTVEPMSSTNLLQETSYNGASQIIPGSSTNISCALCGALIFQADNLSHAHSASRPPTHPLLRTSSAMGLNTNSWSTNLFKKPLSYSTTNSAQNSRPQSPSRPPIPQQVYIFRLASTSSTSNLGVSVSAGLPMASSLTGVASSSQPPHHPSHYSPHPTQNRSAQSTIYPLCTSGWCLARLRLTCSLWAFVRTGIIEKVWEEEVFIIPPSKSHLSEKPSANGASPGKPPLPPRKRGLWGMASAFGERAASWGEGDKGRSVSEKELDKKLPSMSPARKIPPPLPKRAEGRRSRSATISRAASPAPVAPSAPVPAVPEEEESKPTVNGHTKEEDKPQGEVENADDLRSLAPSDTIFDEGPDSRPSTPAKAERTIPENPAMSTPLNSGAQAAGIKASPSVSSTAEKRASQESFASAASVIASDEAPVVPISPLDKEAETPISAPERSSTPHRPATPPQVAPQITPSTPAKMAGADKESPSLTGSPAPPPLPRRAAARARPMSVVLHAAPTPATSDEVKDVSQANPTVEEATSEEVLVPVNDDVKDVSRVSPVETISEVLAPVKEDSAQDSPDASQSAMSSIRVASEEQEGASTPTMNGMPDSEKESTPKEGSTAIATIHGDVVKLGDSEKPTSKIEQGVDCETYVGDVTWEERTWKELVKLKEDMFWARVGGVRS